ncbi:MAG: HEAT repeat domain-containing protein [Chitinophagaceae bacterium]|nr:HEAT repeat domain-containing protein [Chitinophagaceae bacterium]
MGFYDLNKQQRAKKVAGIVSIITNELEKEDYLQTTGYFSHSDTYIRKAAYLSIGRIYFSRQLFQPKIIKLLTKFLQQKDFKIRQTAINAAGEIGKKYFDIVEHIFDAGLFDEHHSPRNAVIGSVKKMGEVNPVPVLLWAKKYLNHPDKEIRREICHGIELRGRKHPEDILPLLRELEYDKTARVRSTLVHVIGQIAYKKGCIEIVINDLNKWKNKWLVKDALKEIIDVHYRYRSFAALTQQQVAAYIARHSKVKISL